MKSVRKGFTLVELLIVITIVGLLGSMMLISGTDAQNAAKVVKIAEGFRSLTAAIVEYNDENPNEVADAIYANNADTIITGATKYIKNDDVFGDDGETAGTYYLDFNGSTLWLTYYLPGESGATNEALKAKAKNYNMKGATNAVPKSAADYSGGQTVYVNVF